MSEHGGCRVGMPVRVELPGSGCRRDCLHRSSVVAYRDAKVLSDEARKIAREAATAGYAAEGAEWDAGHPVLTFKRWLVDNRKVLTVSDSTDRFRGMKNTDPNATPCATCGAEAGEPCFPLCIAADAARDEYDDETVEDVEERRLDAEHREELSRDRWSY